MSLPDLLARWAALAPDECRPLDYDPGAYALEGPALNESVNNSEGSDDFDRPFVLWHVLACAAKRGLATDLFVKPDLSADCAVGPVGGAVDSELGAPCPATAALSAYVAALSVLLPAPAEAPE